MPPSHVIIIVIGLGGAKNRVCGITTRCFGQFFLSILFAYTARILFKKISYPSTIVEDLAHVCVHLI